MANNIKGITVEIGGNTGPLTSALKDVNKTAGDLQGELNQVNRQLKFDPKNVDLLRQKEELTSQETQALKEKQEILKQAVEQAHAAFEKGDLGADKVRAVEREYAKVTSQINDLENKAGKTSFFSKIADKLNITKENIKTALGTIGIAAGAFLGSSIKEAAEAGNAQANLEQTVKSTGGAAGLTAKQMEELAEKEMSVSTFSKDEIESGEGMLATFTKIGKDVFPQATTAMLDMAQKMGTSPKSAALMLGKALNDPATGLSKLTRAGVTFTAQQQKQIKAMEKTGNTAGAQKLMLSELNKEYGGQASAAASTFSGKQKQLANEFKEVKESIGNALLPILEQLGKYLVQLLQPIAQFVSEHPKITAGILSVIAVLGTALGGLNAANNVLGIFGKSIADIGLQSVASFGLVGAAIAGVAVAAALIITHWSQIKTFFAGLWSSIKTGVSGVGNMIKSAFLGAVNGVKSAWNGIGDFFKTIWNGIKSTAESFGNNIKAGFSTLGNWIKSFFSKWGTKILAVLAPFIGIPVLIIQHWSQIKGFFSNLGTSIKSEFDSLTNSALQWGKDFLDGFINGIRAKIGAVGDAVKNVAAKIKSFLGFSVPEQGPLSDADKYGLDFMELLQKTIEDNADKPAEATKKVAQMVSDKIQSIKDSLKTDTKELNNELDKLDEQRTSAFRKNTSKQTAIADEYSKKIKVIKEEISKTKNKKTKSNLENELKKLESAEKSSAKSISTTQKNAISDSYNAKKKAIKAEIEARKDQADKEIAEIKRIGSESKDELNQEIQDRKDFISNVNSLNDELKNALKEKYTEDEKNQEDSLNTDLENLDKWKDKSETYINDVYSQKEQDIEDAATVQEDALHAELDAMDKQAQADTRAQEKQNYDTQVTNLQDKITHASDPLEKFSYEQQLNKLNAERQKTLNQEVTEDKKASLQQQIQDIKTNADKQKQILENEKQAELDNINDIYNKKKDSLNKALDDVKNFYTKKLEDTNLEAESEKLVMQKNQTEIVKLLNSYGDQYKQAGQTLGDRLSEGFQPAIDNIKAMISSITADITQARDSALNAMATAVSINQVPALAIAGSNTTTKTSTTTVKQSISVNIDAKDLHEAAQVADIMDGFAQSVRKS